jgi:hypothetical protein
MKKIIFYIALFLTTLNSFGQESIITTAVPFLTIAPDPRGGAMGDLGVASSPDAVSLFYNTAKYSFIKDKATGIQTTYTPWLPEISNDMALNHIVGYHKINDKQVFALSLKYFHIGEIQFTNESGQSIGEKKPNEFAVTGGYSMLLTDNFSGAISMRFIYSNLTGGISSSSQITHAGIAVAGDLSFFYNKPLDLKGKDAAVTWGINFQNIGTKISYGTNLRPFIPTNLKTGAGFQYNLDDFNSIELNLELNKLMVPTPDSTGPKFDLSVTEGIFTSFSDAPGGFKEELHEITESVGLEYAYNKIFFVRTGLFYENINKGGRQFLTTGIGFKYSSFELNFSYLVPLYRDNALANTMRFSFALYFDKNK